MAGKANRSAQSGSAPSITIIKREEGGGEAGHHGGAWKVAYADFVTAMMAFFLLMWLLNATTEEQRTGLADYFAPTNLFGRTASGSGQPFGGTSPNDPGIAVSNSGNPQMTPGRNAQAWDPDADPEGESSHVRASDAAASGDASPSEQNRGEQDRGDGRSGEGRPENRAGPQAQAAEPGDGRQALTRGGDYAAAQIIKPTTPSDPAAAAASRAAAVQGDAQRERRALEQAGAQLLEAIRRDPALAEAASQLSIQVVPEGLRIQVVDAERRPMFNLGDATPTPQVRELMRKVAQTLTTLPNQVAITGHTDSLTYRGQERGNWELSVDRANATRRILMEAGLGEDRIRSVTGSADRDLLVPAEPFNPVNRRISITVLSHARGGPRGQAASGQAAPGQAAPGQAAPGQAVPGQAALGQAALAQAALARAAAPVRPTPPGTALGGTMAGTTGAAP